MKKKNIGKKTLTAMGAVVAAGLTPGIMAASANQGSIAGMTAADMVAIAGTAYSFDELYAMQQPDSGKTNIDLPEIQVQAYPNATKYGAAIRIIEEEPVSKPSTNEIFRSVEQMPQFPEGDAALMKYIKNNLKYPKGQEDIEGHVILQFVVEKNGKVGEVKVLRSLGNDFDQEAIRVVKTLPKFKPGRQNGKAVSVWYTLPVTFKKK